MKHTPFAISFIAAALALAGCGEQKKPQEDREEPERNASRQRQSAGLPHFSLGPIGLEARRHRREAQKPWLNLPPRWLLGAASAVTSLVHERSADEDLLGAGNVRQRAADSDLVAGNPEAAHVVGGHSAGAALQRDGSDCLEVERYP